jgi:hypothetical protein
MNYEIHSECQAWRWYLPDVDYVGYASIRNHDSPNATPFLLKINVSSPALKIEASENDSCGFYLETKQDDSSFREPVEPFP